MNAPILTFINLIKQRLQIRAFTHVIDNTRMIAYH
jgi:hypothetical protein